MPDPLWLDTNVVAAVANGDTVLEAELKTRATAGRPLLITPHARQELLYGNPLTMKPNKPVAAQQPSPESRVKIEQTMSRLNIKVDMEGGKLPQAERVGLAMQDQVKRPKNLATPPSLQQISESDSLVLSQVKASAKVRGIQQPEMLTRETGNKGVVSQASNYGVKVIQWKGGPPPPSGAGPGPGRPPTPLFGGKIGPGLKSIGGTAAGIGAGLLLDYLASYLKGLV